MMNGQSPSVTAASLHDITSADALAFVDTLFGGADEWKSPLISYRLESEFQADWKEEVGHWLKTAEAHSFLKPLLARLLKRAKRGTRSIGVDPNDRRHNELVAELAPAMVNHYLTHTGWRFVGWETITGAAVDVDLQLDAPDSTSALFQVKAPDQPGHVIGHRRVDGEYDNRVLEAVTHAATQLPTDSNAATFIAVCANRTWPLSGDMRCLVVDLIGSTLQDGSTLLLEKERFGKFWTPAWKHVSGVLVLDYLRADVDFRYPCTVLLNPTARVPGQARWFAHARVCVLDESRTFRWIRGEPGDSHTLPDGTRVV